MTENEAQSISEISEAVEEALAQGAIIAESTSEPQAVVEDVAERLEEPEEIDEAKGPKELDYSYTQNRELSWLQFDRRVLEEALDPSVPLFERMKFISIFSTNLDEFFMVRVGSLTDLSIIAPDIRDNKTNMTPSQQLNAIFAAVKPLIKERDEIYAKVSGKLKKYGFKELDLAALSKKERKFARDYYREFIRPVLSPQIVDERHPFPHLRNKELYVVTLLTEEDGSQHLGIVPVPDNISSLIFDPENPLNFVRAEKLIAFNIAKIFDIYETSEPSIVSVTRNADISFDEEKFSDDEGDYRLHVSRLLKKRNRLNPVRLEIEGKPEKALVNGLAKRLKLSKEQVYCYASPINLGWVFGLDRRVTPEEKAILFYPNFVPRMSEEFDLRRSIIQQIEERDRLLFYPYDSMDPFLRMLQEAAVDPDVISIKITVYRLASESRVASHLAEAAENGKEVTALMELRARFDEANNIDWSGRLEEAGCNIIYGMENYKCHSKVCLITKKKPGGGITYITQIGTGNYNEKTARLYTDLSLMTADEEIGRDAVAFFQNMQVGNLKGDYECLKVAPKGIKRTILKLIDREIAKGSAGRITLKANSVTERDIIDRLAKASQAGVQVRMNIRGICCMLPGIEGKTENLHVRSIVGQFLEHSRIFVFGEGDDMEMFIGSADLMTRNLCHRVEVATPIKDPRAREAILLFLDKIFEDNTKARMLQPDGEYITVAESLGQEKPRGDERFCLHNWCIDHPLQGAKREVPEKADAVAAGDAAAATDTTAPAADAAVADTAAPAADAVDPTAAPVAADATATADGAAATAAGDAGDAAAADTAAAATDTTATADGAVADTAAASQSPDAEARENIEINLGADVPDTPQDPDSAFHRDLGFNTKDGALVEVEPESSENKTPESEPSTETQTEAPVSQESTEDRLARDRAYMSDFPHTTPSAESEAKDAKTGNAKAGDSKAEDAKAEDAKVGDTQVGNAQEADEREPQHSAPKKKGFFARLFGGK